MALGLAPSRVSAHDNSFDVDKTWKISLFIGVNINIQL